MTRRDARFRRRNEVDDVARTEIWYGAGSEDPAKVEGIVRVNGQHRTAVLSAALCLAIVLAGCGTSGAGGGSASGAAGSGASGGGSASGAAGSGAPGGGSASDAAGSGAPGGVGASSAAGGNSLADVTPGSPFSMCVVHNNADDPSITALTKGINQAAKTYHAQVTFFDPSGDPQKQASQIQDCITRKPDVLVVNAVDPEAEIPPVKAASQAGISVITVNANIGPTGQQYIKSFIGSASYKQGQAIGQQIAKDLKGNGNIVVIEGNAGQTDTVNRLNGMKAAFKTAGAHINVLAAQPANWERNKAANVMSQLLTRFPAGKLNAVFAEDDDMAQGALQAIEAAGRSSGLKLYGVNGEVAVCKLIEQGKMAGTALQESQTIGEDAVKAAAALHQGKSLPKEILAPTLVITPLNVKNEMDQCW